MKFPKSMSACADLLFEKREARLAADKIAVSLKSEEQALIDHIIDNLPKDSRGAVGKHHMVKVYTDQKLVVKDWDEFYKYVHRTKKYELLQKRLGEGAAQEIIDDGKKVPGVEPFTVVKVSLTVVK
jgi:hypothetical protein